MHAYILRSTYVVCLSVCLSIYLPVNPISPFVYTYDCTRRLGSLFTNVKILTARASQAGVETYLIERKLDNCKPCGGAIPLCMIDEFDLPKDIVDRQAGGDALVFGTAWAVERGSAVFLAFVRKHCI